ncbi:N-6 DNA methylase [Streptomyces aidingensis]|uniref:Type I restriction-modification system, DNA methylase subunit n=1 Tax=Streptomyces aidingensis TaxID=910347 RepID=A0A1I1MBD4_9ACTN|nr:N-6 DNA methylase [Streptomyces aidingensis]SFC82674.1 Type I restriction-modification system, DNA methylase subunit [Streptomyces aidingensis]
MSVERLEVTSADIARIAGVQPTAVSNWRRRYEDFPGPVGGTDRSPRFDLTEVEAWLRRQGKATAVPAAQRLWQAFDAVRGEMAPEDALALVGLLLLHQWRNPGARLPAAPDAVAGLLEQAEHEFLSDRATGAGVADLVARLPDAELGPRQLALLGEAERAAAEDGPEETFRLLCERFLDEGPRAGFTATRPELADLMVHLAGEQATGTVLDPACGSGTILLAAAARGPRRLQGQEIQPSLARLAALRLAFRRAGDGSSRRTSFDVHTGDFLRRSAYRPGRADAVICYPPFAERNWGHEELAHDPDWIYGLPPRAESELAWVQRALAHAAPGAPVVMMLPPGVAFRPSGRRIRTALLRHGALRAVISLPTGFAAHYALALQIWVLRRPAEGEAVPEHLLLIDSAHEYGPGVTVDGRRVCARIAELWTEYEAGPESFTERPGVARAVRLIDLLDGEADLTPARHLPLPAQPDALAEQLKAVRADFERALHALNRAVPDALDLPEEAGGTVGAEEPEERRIVSLNDLIKRGTVHWRRPTSVAGRPSETDSGSGPGSGTGAGSATGDRARYLTAEDILLSRAASDTGPPPGDPLSNAPVRAGDVLIPVLAGRLAARVATEEDAGAYLTPGVHLVRTLEPELLDPWYLAGCLSGGSGGNHRLTGTSSSGSSSSRTDPRRIRIPLLPIERQRMYGAAFRRYAEFARILRTAHDLGQALARYSTDSIAAALTPAAGELSPTP